MFKLNMMAYGKDYVAKTYLMEPSKPYSKVAAESLLVVIWVLSVACKADTYVNNSAADFRAGYCQNVEVLCEKDGAKIKLVHHEDHPASYVRFGTYTSKVLGDGTESHWQSIKWLEQFTTPQHFKRYENNPVLDPSRTGQWDDWTNGVSIIRFGGQYRMFFASWSGGGIGWATASVDDPVTWTVNPANPVLKPGPSDSFESRLINQPRCIKITDSHWRMYYTGWHGDEWKVGLAESFDGGVTWSKYPDNPILLAGPGNYDIKAACVPHVIKDGDLYKMWYTAVNSQGKISIAYATSENGINWQKYKNNPVLAPIPNSTLENRIISRCCVLKESGTYKMWYSMQGQTYRIGYAESIDGIHWERSPLNPVIDISTTGFDNESTSYPEVQHHDDGTYRMWFCGNGYGSVGYAQALPSPWKLMIHTRSGNSPKPDESWSQWSEPYRHPEGSVILSPTAKYIQYRVELQTADRLPNNSISPVLHQVEIQYQPDPTVKVKIPLYRFKGSHFDIGRQMGRQESKRISNFIKACGVDIKVAMLKKVPLRVQTFREHSPELYEESLGIAVGAGITLDEVMALNFVDEAYCSGIAIAKSHEGPMIGKTSDGSLYQGLNYCLALREPSDGGYRTISLGHVGSVKSETIMNDQGLCMGISGLLGRQQNRKNGISWMVLLRMAGERCKNIQEAVDFFKQYDLSIFGFCLIMGDASGEIAVLEKVPGGHQCLRRPDPGVNYIYEFNEALTPEVKPFAQPMENGAKRWRFARRWFSENPLPQTLEEFKKVWAAKGVPTGFCQVGEDGMLSLACVIMLPKQGVTHIAEGFPDKMLYKSLSFYTPHE